MIAGQNTRLPSGGPAMTHAFEVVTVVFVTGTLDLQTTVYANPLEAQPGGLTVSVTPQMHPLFADSGVEPLALEVVKLDGAAASVGALAAGRARRGVVGR